MTATHPDNSDRTARIIFTVLAVATVIFIFSNSIQGQTESADRSGRYFDLIRKIIPSITHHQVRKLAHMTEFAVLALWLTQLLDTRSTLFAGLVVALTDETIQIFSCRGSSVADVWIDFAGVCIGCCLVKAVSGMISVLKQG